jgi:hypothetical protein
MGNGGMTQSITIFIYFHNHRIPPFPTGPALRRGTEVYLGFVWIRQNVCYKMWFMFTDINQQKQ